MAICETTDCRMQFQIGPVTLARMEAGQPVVCRRYHAAAQMTQADRVEAAAAEPAPEPEPAQVSHGTATCENEDCRKQFPIGPVSLARMEAGQPVVCRRCDATAQTPQADRIKAAATEPVPEPEPGSPRRMLRRRMATQPGAGGIAW